jgi:hypothetical protein
LSIASLNKQKYALIRISLDNRDIAQSWLDLPFWQFRGEELQVLFPQVTNDLAARKTTDRDDLWAGWNSQPFGFALEVPREFDPTILMSTQRIDEIDWEDQEVRDDADV